MGELGPLYTSETGFRAEKYLGGLFQKVTKCQEKATVLELGANLQAGGMGSVQTLSTQVLGFVFSVLAACLAVSRYSKKVQFCKSLRKRSLCD